MGDTDVATDPFPIRVYGHYRPFLDGFQRFLLLLPLSYPSDNTLYKLKFMVTGSILISGMQTTESLVIFEGSKKHAPILTFIKEPLFGVFSSVSEVFITHSHTLTT